MFLNNTKDKIKNYWSRRKEKFSITGVNIEFDWAVVVLISIILLISIFVERLNTFNQIVTGKIYQTKEVTKDFDDSKTISDLDKIISKFEDRKENSIKSN